MHKNITDQSEKLKILQTCCVNILFKFDEVCRLHNLTYYLAYGTLLGAVRHKGFIPWDDDIDLLMPREDMQYIIENFDSLFKEPYTINHYSKPNFNSNSFVLRICNHQVQIKREIGGEARLFDSFISIFPICGMPKGKIAQKLFALKANLLYTKLRFVRSANNGYGNVHRSFKENVGVAINRLFGLGRNCSIIEAVKSIDDLLRKFQYANSNVVGIHSFGYHKFLFDEKDFGKPIYLAFEGRQLPVPAKYEKLLTLFYGDYKKMPPVDKRQPQHGVDIIINELQ